MNPPPRCREFLARPAVQILLLMAAGTLSAQTPSTTIRLNAAGYVVHENAGTLPLRVIRDDAGFGFANTNVVVSANSASVTLTVQRNDDGTNALTVEWFTCDGTARAGQNYVASGGTLHFAIGLTSNTVTVPILDDCLSDGDRVFTVSLRNPSTPSVLGTNAVAVMTIQGNDRPGTCDISFRHMEFSGLNGVPEPIVVAVPNNGVLIGAWGGLFQVHSDSSPDPEFISPASVNAMAPQPDGRIVVQYFRLFGPGDFYFYLGRLMPKGDFDSEFQPPASHTSLWGLYPDVVAIQVQPDGRILLAHDIYPFYRTSVGVTRLMTDGSLDLQFDPGSGAQFEDWRSGVRALELQGDGRILVGGLFRKFSDNVCNGVVRLQTNGAVDLSFSVGGGPTNEFGPAISVIAIQPDGRILIAGGGNGNEWSFALPDFTHVNGVPRPGVARLLPNGALDLSFDPGEITGGFIRALALQQNGKVVIGGSFTNVQGFRRDGLARLNRDGSIDLGFDPAPYAYNVVALALQSDGRIVISDASTGLWRVNGDPVPRLRDLMRLPENRTAFSFRTQPGETYTVESSTNLVDWLPLSTNLANACRLRLTNSPSPSPSTFYRVVQPVP